MRQKNLFTNPVCTCPKHLVVLAGKSSASAASSDDSASKTKKGINAVIQPVKGIFKHGNKGE